MSNTTDLGISVKIENNSEFIQFIKDKNGKYYYKTEAMPEIELKETTGEKIGLLTAEYLIKMARSLASNEI